MGRQEGMTGKKNGGVLGWFGAVQDKMMAKVPGLGWSVIISGIAFGVLGMLLVVWGNPINTGVCVSCFMEGIAGSIGLHNNIRMMYIRPEILGFILGAFVMAMSTGDFKPTGGSSPVLRFVLGIFSIIGSAMFIGCPIKMLYRFASGDLTALAAIAGMFSGIWFGVKFMRRGFFLGDETPVAKTNGWVVPLLALLFLSFLYYTPSFVTISDKGPSAMHAPILISLGAGLVIGALTQRSRFCVVGAVRNFMLAHDKSLMIGLGLMLLAAVVTSVLTGQFHLGMVDQPGSHLEHGWSFLGMFLTGLASVQLGGCPYRQLILAGEGNADSGITTLGMLVGAGVVHSWNLASSTAGTTFNGRIAVLAGIALCLVLGLVNRD